MGEARLELPHLNSARSNARLKAISSARKKGVSEHVSLPQIIVCGDQSAGKSSVLEGVSGFPFPRQDGLCTRFATEIILQDEDTTLNIKVSIIPHSSQDNDCRDLLLAFCRELDSFDDLPVVIADAGAAMGLRGFGSDDASPAFAQDVLQIRVSGPTGLHLSVVDLPGIIQVPSEDQTEADVDAVHSLVDSYMANPRSIILAVVQAGNDIANQPVIRKCKHFDPSGERTIGVITKPDLINDGAESRIAQLARNEDTTKLKLGFFLLKNPSPKEMEKIHSSKDREIVERGFFTSAPWMEQNLDLDRLGVEKLKRFLQDLLDEHVAKEMPKVRQELRRLEKSTADQLLHLGSARTTTADLRIYLSRLAMKFDSICASALLGNYSDSQFFGSPSERVPPTRLRAIVHAENIKFADIMKCKGEKRKLGSWSDPSDSDEVAGHASCDNDQLLVTEHAMKTWVKKVYTSTRGRELPGDHNHVFLSELFHEQASRWLDLSTDHLRSMYQCLETFMDQLVSHVTEEDHTRQKLRESISAALETMKRRADEELTELWEDEAQQPITYNHYYTDNIQKARNGAAREVLKKAMADTTDEDYGGRMHISNNNVDIQKLLGSLQNRIVVNMDDQACAEARAALNAYYKVARKTFVDNVCRQVIERHLLRDLSRVFSPEKVAAYTDEELHLVAGESRDSVEKRDRLQRFHLALKECLVDLA
ncbi:hypothetical protein DOTSEDRAFT_71579 [Dothistroma septosporum NZE10]|uniref:GED domain-containing protein n=1 Tax=Dothistroma septosporum (strain NZE10 / CBS 128990) TaxID=675120 RepID=N1PL81_DOTSN|nr:hypothetical protein DOTSEDRAFT_71579 [Dothistroma septosporum NZE10]